MLFVCCGLRVGRRWVGGLVIAGAVTAAHCCRPSTTASAETCVPRQGAAHAGAYQPAMRSA